MLLMRNAIMLYLSAVKSIFFLRSSNRPSNQSQLDGILRAAKAFGWNVRTLEFGMASPSHQRTTAERHTVHKNTRRKMF